MERSNENSSKLDIIDYIALGVYIEEKGLFLWFKIFILILIILLLVLLKSCSYLKTLFYNNDSNLEYSVDDSATVIDPGMSEDEIIELLNNKVKEGMINISMNLTPYFATGTSAGNLRIVNEKINKYPQIVYIVISETGQEIYRSKGIPVGSEVTEDMLDVDLDPGVYECTAYFNNVNEETGNIIGTAGAEITITVAG